MSVNLPPATLYIAVLFLVSSCRWVLNPDEFSVVADADADAGADAAVAVIDAQPDARSLLCANDLNYEAGPSDRPNTYRRIDQVVTWEEAKVACEAEDAHLVVIEDDVEANHVNLQFGENSWIGLSDTDTEGVYVWVDGSPLTYERWHPGEPNNAGDGEDYIEIIQSGNWNDISLDGGGDNRPVCECPLAP